MTVFHLSVYFHSPCLFSTPQPSGLNMMPHRFRSEKESAKRRVKLIGQLEDEFTGVMHIMISSLIIINGILKAINNFIATSEWPWTAKKNNDKEGMGHDDNGCHNTMMEIMILRWYWYWWTIVRSWRWWWGGGQWWEYLLEETIEYFYYWYGHIVSLAVVTSWWWLWHSLTQWWWWTWKRCCPSMFDLFRASGF